MFQFNSVCMQLLLAEVTPSAPNPLTDIAIHLIAVILYSLVGIVVLGTSFWIMRLMMPFSVRKEIEEDQNIALGIIIGSVIIGMSIIIAAAIH